MIYSGVAPSTGHPSRFEGCIRGIALNNEPLTVKEKSKVHFILLAINLTSGNLQITRWQCDKIALRGELQNVFHTFSYILFRMSCFIAVLQFQNLPISWCFSGPNRLHRNESLFSGRSLSERKSLSLDMGSAQMRLSFRFEHFYVMFPYISYKFFFDIFSNFNYIQMQNDLCKFFFNWHFLRLHQR